MSIRRVYLYDSSTRLDINLNPDRFNRVTQKNSIMMLLQRERRGRSKRGRSRLDLANRRKRGNWDGQTIDDIAGNPESAGIPATWRRPKSAGNPARRRRLTESAGIQKDSRVFQRRGEGQ